VKAYMAEYKDYPSAWAVEGYDGIYFLVEAIKKAGALDTEKIITALEGLSIDSRAAVDAPQGRPSIAV